MKLLIFITLTFFFTISYSQVFDTLLDVRDGQKYEIVQIGDQWWMAENLNFYTSTDSWYYDFDSIYYAEKYGRYYTWEQAIKVCPSGWHLPSDNDWNQLFEFLGGSDVAGGKMKKAGDSWAPPNETATNESGFSAVPGGSFFEGRFMHSWVFAYIWTSTEVILFPEYAGFVFLYYDYPHVDISSVKKTDANPVRCIKDSDESNISLSIQKNINIDELKFKQNQLIVGIEIESDKDLSDVIIESDLNGNLMNIHISEDDDLNQDSRIDTIKAGRPTTIVFSSKEFNSTQSELDLTVSVTSISGQPVNKSIDEVISLYFAKNSNEQNRPFNSNPDYYQFENDNKCISLDEFIHEFHVGLTRPLLLAHRLNNLWRGRCYGLVASAGAYFKTPSIKPIPGYPWEWGEDLDNVILSNINTFQLAQQKYDPSFDNDPGYTFNRIAQQIAQGNPVIIGMRTPPDQQNEVSKHAVLATKITNYKNAGFSMIHIYNTWDIGSLDKIIYNHSTNQFDLYSNNSYYEFCLFPQSAFIEESPEIILNYYYGHTTTLLDSLKQKIFASACPVNMYVMNSSGEKHGYLDNGVFVGEIATAESHRIATNNYIGDSATYIQVPSDDNYQVFLYATDTGTVRFEYYEPEDKYSHFFAISNTISISNGSVLTFNDSNSSEISIDNNGDGVFEKTDHLFESTISKNEYLSEAFDKIMIYPNPFTQYTIIRLPASSQNPYQLFMWDLSGKLVRQERNISELEYRLNSNGLSRGIYFLEMRGAKLYRGKIIIH